MVQSELNWDHHIPFPKLTHSHSRVLICLAALLCFMNSYDGEFVFDDSEAIINNKDLKPETALSNIWRNDFWGSNLSSNTSHKSYRPLTVLTFRLNYLLAGGLHPVGFHVLNIALHSAISVLMIDVFAILIGGLAYDGKGKRLNQAPKASSLAALFFAVHPVHTESVAGIVGRADLLCALFFQLSFLTYCRAFQGGDAKDDKYSTAWIVASLILCAVAMLCKEQGITVLGVNAAFDILMICNVNVYELSQRVLFRAKTVDVNELFKRGFLTRMALLTFGGALLVYARWRIMGTGPPAFTEVDNPASFAENVFLRTVNYNYYYSLNAWLLLCPWWLCFDWSMGCVPLIKSVGDWRIISLLLLWSGLFGLICQALCSQDSYKRRTLTFGLVMLVIPFLPASNLFFRVGFVIAERVLYLSTAGYCLILTYGVGLSYCLWRKHKKLLHTALLGLLCLNVARSAFRSQQWRSEQSLFTSALSVCPLNAKYADLNRHLDALNAWKNATMLKPDHSLAWNNMVILLDNTERGSDISPPELQLKYQVK
ncbi:hypothetical protein JZ751_028020 [Albula glossodonta]|uniref:DUF1736 domain-containing protein n=1 Tax=Albula glossodonta TaxID=121402 RepID=A0A8T2PIV7_9TELE|nr:hypothetical protein JZ751_028020 [Albula glossodonta]